MKKISIKNANISIIIALLFAFIGMYSLGVNTNLVGKITLYELSASIVYILPLIVVMIFLIFTGFYKKIFEERLEIKSVFLNGWYVLFAGVLLFGFSYMGLTKERSPSTQDFLLFIISCLCTATFEELLFRAVIQNTLIEGFKNSKKSVWSAIIVSSIIFGIVHIGNLLANHNLVIMTLSQIIYAFALGIILGTTYYITKNIFSTIFLHAVFNILGSFSVLYMLPKSESADITIVAALLQIIVILPSIYIARKKYKELMAK